MRTSKIQNGRQGAPKWLTGSEKGSTPRFLGAPVNFRFLFDAITPSMRKCFNREKNGKKWNGKELSL